MSSNSRLIAVISCSTFFLLGTAFGQKTAIQADVKGVDGRAAKAAEVRIERQDKKTAPVIVKTDWRGHLTANNLEAGTYKVTAIVAGGVQSSQIVKTQTQKPSLVTFDLTKTQAAISSAKKKRYVWVPAPTGTNIGGGWVEVSDDGTRKSGANGQNIDNMDTNSLERMQNKGFTPPSIGGR